MKHPDKWRDTLDVFKLPLGSIKIIEVLGYPHAGNDVVHLRILYQQRELTAYIKVERQAGADISNEVKVLSELALPFVPKLLSYSLNEPRYIITEEAFGERLSKIVEDKPSIDVKTYLVKQADLLSQYHNTRIKWAPVKDRRFFHIPDKDYCEKYSLDSVRDFLTSHIPQNHTNCFVHGDFHYANMLWDKDNISCVLDYELSGQGICEFDMAWSIFLRPSQSFADAWDDVIAFLSGYNGKFDFASFCYYYIQIAVHFYPLGNEGYQQKVLMLIDNAVEAYFKNKQ